MTLATGAGSARSKVACLGGGLLVLFILFLRRGSPEKQTAEKAVEATAKQSVVQHASPTTNVYVNQPAPVVTPAPPRVESAEKSKPNVVFLGARSVNLGFYSGGEGSLEFEETKDTKNRLAGIVACFRNDPIYGKPVKSVHGAKAHLKFIDANNAEIGTGVSAPCWLNTRWDTFDLIPGGNGGCVLVLLKVKDRGYSTPWKRRENTFSGDFIRDQHFDLDALPHRIEVNLLGPDDQLLLPPIILEITSPNEGLQVTVTGKLQTTIKSRF
jgi:hypothetical protein